MKCITQLKKVGDLYNELQILEKRGAASAIIKGVQLELDEAETALAACLKPKIPTPKAG